MRDRQPSHTAELVAFARAMESMRPDGIRVCYDPYARYFIGRTLAFMLTFPFLRRMAAWRGERTRSGVLGYIAVRTRHMDDYLLHRLSEGIDQLVILGAGYDSRAYRFRDKLHKVRVFEIDHPATQRAKIEKLRRIFGDLPGHVVYVPVDLDRESLAERLFECGYKSELKTAFIWEGVTYYITEEAVDQTLLFVSGNSRPGSSIIFDYVDSQVLENRDRFRVAKGLARLLARMGETLKTGLDPEHVEDFLSKRGFEHIDNVSSARCKELYFHGINSQRTVSKLFGIASARVKLPG